MLGRFVAGTFCCWDVLLLGRFVAGTFCCWDVFCWDVCILNLCLMMFVVETFCSWDFLLFGTFSFETVCRCTGIIDLLTKIFINILKLLFQIYTRGEVLAELGISDEYLR